MCRWTREDGGLILCTEALHGSAIFPHAYHVPCLHNLTLAYVTYTWICMWGLIANETNMLKGHEPLLQTKTRRLWLWQCCANMHQEMSLLLQRKLQTCSNMFKIKFPSLHGFITIPSHAQDILTHAQTYSHTYPTSTPSSNLHTSMHPLCQIATVRSARLVKCVGSSFGNRGSDGVLTQSSFLPWKNIGHIGKLGKLLSEGMDTMYRKVSKDSIKWINLQAPPWIRSIKSIFERWVRLTSVTVPVLSLSCLAKSPNWHALISIRMQSVYPSATTSSKQ